MTVIKLYGHYLHARGSGWIHAFIISHFIREIIVNCQLSLTLLSGQTDLSLNSLALLNPPNENSHRLIHSSLVLKGTGPPRESLRGLQVPPLSFGRLPRRMKMISSSNELHAILRSHDASRNEALILSG